VGPGKQEIVERRSTAKRNAWHHRDEEAEIIIEMGLATTVREAQRFYETNIRPGWGNHARLRRLLADIRAGVDPYNHRTVVPDMEIMDETTFAVGRAALV